MKTLIVAIVAVLLVSCGTEPSADVNTQNQEVGAIVAETIGVEDWSAKVAEGTGLVLDVRTPEELKGGKVAGALNVDFLGQDFIAGVRGLSTDKTVYVYCASGGRSKKAMAKLKAMGFEKVYDLAGGFGAWKAAGKPVELP